MALRQRLCGLLALLAATMVGAAAQVHSSRASEADPAGSRIAGDWRASPPGVMAAPTKLPPAGADLGAAPAGARIERVLLLLEPSPEQRQALDAELANQQDPGSPEYHHWLTPSQFADKYANSASDVAAIVSWLESEGFAVAPPPAGRGWIEFSGTVAQLEQAFQTGVHAVTTRSGERLALAGPVSVPAALQPLIYGLVSLDGVVAEPAITTPQPVASAIAELQKAASPVQAEALTPQLMAELLHLDALHVRGTTGAGETIAIAARSNIEPLDVAAFRASFGLAANPVQVVLNGADPGRTGDEAAALMMASWAGAAAPGARIVLTPAGTTSATDGLDLSLAVIVDQQAAHTMAVGYTACESALSEAHRAFYTDLYRQAAAQGMAVIAASGDSGAAACHPAGSDAAVTTGLAVNGLASTPWNTAAGAVAFNTSGTSPFAAWSPVNPADPAYASGGGSSTTAGAPGWQAAAMPNASGRTVPDIALPTALDTAASRGLAICFSGSGQAAPGCRLVRAGGSSAAAAIFSGISALLAQKYGAQGNLAPRLYALVGQAGIFTDVQQGSARLACVAGSPDCDTSGHLGYDAAAGYDLATGLGSIDAQKLVDEWARPEATGTGASSVVLTVSPSAQNNTYNPSAQITFAVTVSSLTGGATPTGTVTFSDATSNGTISIGGSAVMLDSSGKASVTVNSGLALGGNSVTAQYSGDSTYAAAASSPAVVVNIAKSQTTPTISSPATVAAGASFSVTVTITSGTPPAGSLPPSGVITMAVDGVAVATSNLGTAAGVTSAKFNLTAPTTSGSHNLQASYPGDANYSSSVATQAFSISKAATVTTLTATPAVLTPGTTETLTATVAPLNSSTTSYTITGTVSFFDGSVLLGTATLSMNSASLSGLALSTATSHSLTAVYSGDSSWAASTSSAVVLTPVLLADSVTLTVSPATAAPGQVVTLIATVTPATAPAATSEQNPTGNVVFFNGSTTIGTVALAPGPNHTATATLLSATLAAGTDTIYAYYVGDSFYAAGTSNSITITVQDFSITPASGTPADLDILKGSSGQASFIVTALGGFAAEMQLVCTVPTQEDMTCLPSPVIVTPTATVTFTVQTFAAGGMTTSSIHHSPFWPRALGGTALAALVFIVLPFGRRARVFTGRVRGFIVIGLLLIGMGGAGIGCSNSVTAPVNNGTPLGMTTLKITGSAYVDNTVVSHSAYLTVNVLPPNSTGTAVPATGRRRK